jgi:hypothetical protein
MDERSLIKKAKDYLTMDGGVAWSGSTFRDVFTIFDIIYLSPDGDVSFYQVSTKDHRWQREMKIIEFKNKVGVLPKRSYLMLWDYRIDQFVFKNL